MAKKKMNEEMCESKSCGGCPCWFSWAVLVIGVLYLLGDLRIWTWFAATFSWWTVAFLLVGLKKVCKGMM